MSPWTAVACWFIGLLVYAIFFSPQQSIKRTATQIVISSTQAWAVFVLIAKILAEVSGSIRWPFSVFCSFVAFTATWIGLSKAVKRRMPCAGDEKSAGVRKG